MCTSPEVHRGPEHPAVAHAAAVAAQVPVRLPEQRLPGRDSRLVRDEARQWAVGTEVSSRPLLQDQRLVVAVLQLVQQGAG